MLKFSLLKRSGYLLKTALIHYLVRIKPYNTDMQIPDIPDLIHYAIPFFVVTVLLEIILTVKVKLEEYDYKDSGTSIIMGLGNVAIGLFTKGIMLSLFYFIYNFYHLFEISFVWWAWVILVFADDFCYYWFHRISHESRFFWASHVVHHSSTKYNLSTALRQTWSGSFYTFIFWFPLILIGFHPIMILVQMSISLIYQYWIHTEFIDKTPKWFEAIFNTPSHHRVHHATNPQYLDRNHAGIFIIWDKLFGTFELEREKPVYGLVKNIETYNPIKIAFIEWQTLFKDFFTSKTSLKNKFKYLIKPPGWRHDGSSILSSDLRKKWEEINEVNK